MVSDRMKSAISEQSLFNKLSKLLIKNVTIILNGDNFILIFDKYNAPSHPNSKQLSLACLTLYRYMAWPNNCWPD